MLEFARMCTLCTFCGSSPVLLHVPHMWGQQSVRMSALTLCHTHTHPPDPHSSFLHSALKGSILMTVNSPDNRALSIFRQYCSVVKWTNTQRMRLLAGLMMPDWLAAADASGDEDVIYPFLTLSLSVSLPRSFLPLSHLPSFGSCSSQWSISLCSVKEESDSNRITLGFVHFTFVPLQAASDTVDARSFAGFESSL